MNKKLILTLVAGAFSANVNAEGINLSPVVVTATRTEQNSFDLPVSIDLVDAETIQDGRMQFSIAESLSRVPGIVAASRGQSAQDVQISSRGFGARSAFGVRGVRLYADGIPLTMPDGQGQAGTFDLSSAKSIEVMRGPFSALYGNSSGGVVQILTEDGAKEPYVSGSFTTGSYGANRESTKVSGSEGIFNYLVDYSHYESDGYRQHSAVRQSLFNAKLGINFSQSTRLTLLVTDLDQPLSQDPGGLKAADLNNPKQVYTKVNSFNTRVSKSQSQVGAKLEHDFDEKNTLNLMVYGGVRQNEQYQSTGANTTNGNQLKIAGRGYTASTTYGNYYYITGYPNGSAGGVAQIDRDFHGVDLRYTNKGDLAGGAYSFTIGTNYDTMTDDRKGYDNFILINGTTIPNNTSALQTLTCGTQVSCGVKGLLRRDEKNSAWNFDQYAQATWSPTTQLNLVAGVRHSNVTLKSVDNFQINGDGSGSSSFSDTLPVIGLLYKANESLNFYANAGQGFETPSLVEVAYLSDGSGGFNKNIKPATSNNYEVGVKAFIGANTRATLALFKTDTSNEIVVAENVNGRSSYQNAGGTERNGAELVVDSYLGNGFSGYASYAYLDAKYTDPFCSGQSASSKLACTSGTWVLSEKSIPGTYRQTAYAELNWKHAPSGFSTALETRGVGQVQVSDKGSDKASGYAILNWRGGFAQNINKWHFSEFIRIENLLEKNYVGSVKVNDVSSQFYEPGAGRNWMLGLNASYHF
jgi:iron complex outermembrane receptor protein